MIRNSGQTSTASCKVYFYISIANYRSTIEAWFQVLSMALLTSIPACNIPCFYPPIDYVNDSSWLTWRSQPINKPHKHRSCPIFPIRLIQVLTLGYIASMRSAKLVMCSMHVYISYKYVLVWLETVFIYCQTAVAWCTSSTAFHDPMPYSKSMFVAALLVVRLIALRHRVPFLVFNLNFMNFIHWNQRWNTLCTRTSRDKLSICASSLVLFSYLCFSTNITTTKFSMEMREVGQLAPCLLPCQSDGAVGWNHVTTVYDNCDYIVLPCISNGIKETWAMACVSSVDWPCQEYRVPLTSIYSEKTHQRVVLSLINRPNRNFFFGVFLSCVSFWRYCNCNGTIKFQKRMNPR